MRATTRPSAVTLAAFAAMVMLTSVVILATGRGQVVVKTSGQAQLVVEIPSKFERWWWGVPAEISLRGANGHEPIASLLYGTWDRPVLIVENERTKDVLCLYDYDGSVELLVFSPANGNAVASVNPHPLGIVVRRARWNVRLADKPDIDELVSWVRGAQASAVKQRSVPRFDIGIYRHYLGADSLNSMLQRVFPWHDGRWQPNAAGQVRFQ
jgi:hypothetical protein